MTAKQTFEEIKPWDGTSDTGAQARQKIARNFTRVNDAIDTIEGEIGNMHSGLPLGGIIMWGGSATEIPVGFNLCDGSNVAGFGVVPDLRSKFVVGFDPLKPTLPTTATDLTENYGAIGNKGGLKSVLLTSNQYGLKEHSHSIKIVGKNNGYKYVGFGSSSADIYPNSGTIATDNNTSSSATEAHENRPPYYVLAFIIKTSGDGTGGSAYQSYLNTTGDPIIKTEEEWVLSLSGDGISAYAIAVNNGFVGTEAEWLASLHGTDGTNGIDGVQGFDGLSAYEIAVSNGFVGTEAQWLASLHGANGTNGADGTNGTNAPVTMHITMLGANGLILPPVLPAYTYSRIITEVRLGSNCSGLSVTIGANSYNETNLTGVTIPANVELIVNSLTIVAGKDNADALIIF